jgi:SAM-dependent methyltransferase
MYGQEYYEGRDSNYGVFGGYSSILFGVSRFLVRRRVFSGLKHKVGGKHIDLGCAYGYLVEYMQRKGFRSVGVDVSGFAVREAGRRFPGLDIRRVDIEKGLGFPDSEFDVVTAMDVLEHCRNLAGVLREIRRVLKDDGLVLASFPDSDIFPEERDLDETHIWRMNAGQWKGLFREGGFKVIDTWVFPGWLKRIRPHWCVSMALLGKA